MDKDLLSIQEARDMIRRAKEAEKVYSTFSQEQVDRITEAAMQAAFDANRRLAEIAVEETGFGRVESKMEKNTLSTKVLWNDIKNLKTVGIVERDEAKKVFGIAVPFGVVGAIIPVTNPTSTVIFKALICLKSRNAMVASPHPRAIRCTAESVSVIRNAAEKAGAPEGLLDCLTLGTMEGVNELLQNRDVALILATGGTGLVRAAYSAGKPAFGVGPGNCPAYIDRSADVRHAVTCIVSSKMFDYGTVCASEQSIVVDRPVKDDVVRELKNQGAYFASEDEVGKLEKIALIGNAMNPAIVGKPAHKVAEVAGFSIPRETTLLVAPQTKIGREYPLSKEQLCTMIAFYVSDGWRDGCQMSIDLLKQGGLGHSIVVHATNEEVILAWALEKPASRIMVNAPASQGSVGYATRLDPSMTLGCGTFGGNISADNITARHLLNIKRLAFVTDDFFADKGLKAPRTGVANSFGEKRIVCDKPKAAAIPAPSSATATLISAIPRKSQGDQASEIRSMIEKHSKSGCAVTSCTTRDCSYCT
ncbi:MAG: aldehyde dehydrogenase family protein [Planctomycetes bacterium]|nr:aldehyde dehydrogenase family protein [Planctomycetota bacterium]